MKRWELVAIVGVDEFEFNVDEMTQEEIEVMRGTMEVYEGVGYTRDPGDLIEDPKWDADYKEGFDTAHEAYLAMDDLATRIQEREADWYGYEAGGFDVWASENEQGQDESDKEYFARWAATFEDRARCSETYFTAIIRDRETGKYEQMTFMNPVIGYESLMEAYERAEENGHPWTW